MRWAAVAHLSSTAADLKHLDDMPGWKMSFQHRKGSSGEEWSSSHVRLSGSLTNSPAFTAEDTRSPPTLKCLTHLNIICTTTAKDYKARQQTHLHNSKTSLDSNAEETILDEDTVSELE